MVPDQAIDELQGLRLHHELRVFGAEVLRHDPGMRPLVVRPAALEADAERLDPALRLLRHEGHDTGRVEPAREKGTEGHVSHESALHGRTQEHAEVLFRVVIP